VEGGQSHRSRECAPDNKLRVPTISTNRWACAARLCHPSSRAASLHRKPLQQILHQAAQEIELVSRHRHGLAPAIACRAALAIVPGFCGLACNAASDAESRSGIGAIPPAVMRMNWNEPAETTAGRTLDQMALRMAAADGALVERVFARSGGGSWTALIISPAERVVGGAIGAVTQQVADRQPLSGR